MNEPYEDPGFSVWLHALPPSGAVTLGPIGQASLLLGDYARSDPDFPYPGSAYRVAAYMGELEGVLAATTLLYIAARNCSGEC